MTTRSDAGCKAASAARGCAVAGERLIDDTLRAQPANRRNESSWEPIANAPVPAAAPAPAPARDPRASLRHLISELATRLDRTQEQLLARLGDLNESSRKAAGAEPPIESGLLEELLARLAPEDPGALDHRLRVRFNALEENMSNLVSTLADRAPPPVESAPVSAELEARLAALETASRSAGSARDIAALTERVAGIADHPSPAAAGSPTAGSDPAALRALEARLESIEVRLGGDAGATTLGAAISRLAEKLERFTAAAAGAAGAAAEGTNGAAERLAACEEKLERLLGAVVDSADGADDAKRTHAALKRELAWVVHSIDGHLQEIRHRSDQIECALEELKAAVVPIGNPSGVVIGGN